MKNQEQTITITIPQNPAAPAEVRFAPGPLAREAGRLAAQPGSGWGRAPGDDPLLFLVDRRLAAPKPLRKERPDASARMKAYNEKRLKAGGAGAEAPKLAPQQPAPQPAQPAGETLEQWQERKAREKFAQPARKKPAAGFDF